MLSRLFSKRQNTKTKGVTKGKGSYNWTRDTVQALKATENKDGALAKDIVLNDAQRQLYQHEMPTEENDMGTMLRMHEDGTIFPNIAVLDEPEESLEARYRRLTRLQPRICKRRLDVPDHITVELRKEVEEYPLLDILSLDGKKAQRSQYKYVLIKRAALILTPLSSFIDSHSDVVVSIVDSRKRGNKVARTLRLQDNKQYKGEFALDYSFPKESSQKVSISFAQEVPTFDVGEQWAACQIFLDLEESDFPQQVAFQETIGQAAFTTSMMNKYEFHPAHLDLAVRDSNLSQIRNLYERGMIVDETEPHHDNVGVVKYAKSSGDAIKATRRGDRKVQIGQGGEVDWSAVRNAPKPMQARDEISKDPSEDEEEEIVMSELARKALEAERVKNKKNVRVDSHATYIPEKAIGKGHVDDDDSDEGTPIKLSPLATQRKMEE